MRKLLTAIRHAPRFVFVKMIGLYQATLSPDHGPLKALYPYGYCRHEPTCSEYGKAMISKHGVIIGGILLLRRLLSCHPWHRPSDEKIRKTIERTSQE